MGTCLLCSRPSRKRGYCDSHYQTERRSGRLAQVRFPPKLRDDWTPDREGLAWAAGFADGEASFYVTTSTTTRSGVLPHFDVPQSSLDDRPPPSLVKFQHVMGFGRLDGPRSPRRGPDGRQYLPSYKLQFNGHQQVQAVLAMLWPWLGDIKRAQGITTLRRSRVQH